MFEEISLGKKKKRVRGMECIQSSERHGQNLRHGFIKVYIFLNPVGTKE